MRTNDRHRWPDIVEPFRQQSYLLCRVNSDVIGMTLQTARVTVFVFAFDAHGVLLVQEKPP
jgi:hypothetical protein